MEHLRKREQQREQLSMERADAAPAAQRASNPPEEDDERASEQMLGWLDRCLGALSPGDRSLILGYYGAEPGGRAARRRALAVELRLTPNALSIRACRIRNRLEDCVRKAAAGR
jgi:DNA-directed RNA polymerase specialized sigma24 family protein